MLELSSRVIVVIGRDSVADLALAGMRVLAFTIGWAAPMATMMLANMGAEVISVESNQRIDEGRLTGPSPDGVLGGVNSSANFNHANRGKKSCTLNLKQPKAVKIVKQLVKVSDVFVENFSPPVMPRLGLDYEACKTLKPDIIYLSLSGYGATGPNRAYVAWGQQLQAFSGLVDSTGYVNGPPRNLGTPISDQVAAITGCLGILAALHHRNITGEGQYIDISECEALAALCPEAVLDYTMNGRVHGRVGNRDDIMAPHSVYRCKGEDNWVSIAVSTEEEWRGLCEVIGRPDLASAPRFADMFTRHHNQEELDTIVLAWTIKHTDYEAMHLLQGKGVPASAVLSNTQMVRDPHLRERGFCVEDDHPETGKRTMGGFSWHLSRTSGKTIRHAPLLGEHNKEVFCNLLGMSENEVTDLMNQGVIY